MGDSQVMTVRARSLRTLKRAFPARLAILATALFASSIGLAEAQQGAVLSPGDAVMTGFPGAAAQQAPGGADPFDYYMLNPQGPAARVVDLTSLGPQGQLSSAPKTFTVPASQVGTVFGIAIDDAAKPNFYLAPTSVYGLEIGVTDSSGQLKRVHAGTPGAQFVQGQFGAGGGPGTIWRVDGSTGAVSQFATINTAGVAALGGLAFDPRTRQIFAADRTTGVIYRISLTGSVNGTYDHGVEGRPNAGLTPAPLTPTAPANISSPAFSTENTATWGFATPARRVFALAVHDNRLYYSIAQGPQVWSAGISASGSIPGKDARLEVEVPSLGDGVEITAIDFDSAGRMYLAERGATTGEYYLYHLAKDGQTRVLRYQPKAPGDTSPGRWTLVPEQYSVGLAPNYDNADGGVALYYGYRQDQSGTIDFGACDQTVWSTGERLLDPGDPNAQPGSFPYVDGLQGNDNSLVQPDNTPPYQSWFIDYDDSAGHPDFRGQMGAIATLPCPVQAAPPPPPPPPPISCPPGTYFDGHQCVIYPTCPTGTTYQNGQCVYPTCPQGFVLNNGRCVPPPVSCPQGSFFYQGQCIPIACPPNMTKLPNGQCVCPPGNVYFNGQCIPPQQCPPGSVTLPGGVCWCPLGMIFGNGVCQPPPNCGPFQDLWNGQCLPKCPPGKVHMPPNGVCGPGVIQPPPPFCLPGKELWNGQCVDKCPVGQFHKPPNGECTPFQVKPPIFCLPGKELWNGQCVDKCPVGQYHKPPNGQCTPFVFQPPVGPNQPPVQVNPGALCALQGKEMWNGQCVDKCTGNDIHLPPNGQCGPKPVIQPPVQVNPGALCALQGKEMWNGQCVDKCTGNDVHLPPNGQCGPKPVIQPPVQVNPGALCALQGKEMWNGQCVDKCTGNDIHLPPNGQCGPKPVIQPPVQVNPGALCALQGKEMWNGQCVDKCTGNDIHLPPNGQCGPKPVIQPPVQVNPGALCALQGKEMWNGQCVDKCTGNDVHLPPNGQCGPKPVIQPPVQVNPGALCALQGKEMWNGQCVEKCTGNDIHLPPNGNCGPKPVFQPPIQVKPILPLQQQEQAKPAACEAGKEMYRGKCLDVCPSGQEHVGTQGTCRVVRDQDRQRQIP